MRSSASARSSRRSDGCSRSSTSTRSARRPVCRRSTRASTSCSPATRARARRPSRSSWLACTRRPGVVSKGHLVEAGRADLVAGYVGQTAIKVQEVVRRAIGGVLFIDEAYALATDGFVDFGDEAIATLVQMMEEHRDDLAVIVAGYSEEMRTFIESNPGLRSRFTHYVHFPNYTAEELVEIFRSIAAGSDVVIGDGVLDRVRRRWSRPRRRPVTSATPATCAPSSKGPMPAWRPVPSPTGRSPTLGVARPRARGHRCGGGQHRGRRRRRGRPADRVPAQGLSGRGTGSPQRTRRYVLSDRRATLRTTTRRALGSSTM